MDDLSNNNMDNKDFPFGFRRQPVDDRLREENWNKIEETIRKQEGARIFSIGQEKETPSIRWGKIFTAAAAITAIIIGCWYIGTRTGRPAVLEIRTAFGEVKHILLPDSSVVVLNANSKLRIPQQWTERGGRQVWLEGEAYFQVEKQVTTRQKFVVHTRQVDVEVLGTKFNVNTRREHAIVSLEEGKVQLSVNGDITSVLEKKTPTVLRPGQVAIVDETSKATINAEKDITAHSGWSRNEFHFDNTSLGEIAHLIEDTYGYEVIAEDSSMFNFAISGDVRVSNVQELVKVLELPSGYTMRIKNKTIYITRH